MPDLLTTLGPIALGAVPAMGLAWAIRSWVYGGSLIRVEFRLGRLDGEGTLTAGPVTHWQPHTTPSDFFPGREGKFVIDVAEVTVRNLGRTPATVSDVGLDFGRDTGSQLGFGGVLLPRGETENRVRVEAHDSRTFVFRVWPLIEAARRERIRLGGLGVDPVLNVRAKAMTGIGKMRRSRRNRHRRGFRWERNVWRVAPGARTLAAREPTIESRLFDEFYDSGTDAAGLQLDIVAVLDELRAGRAAVDVARGSIAVDPGQRARVAMITFHADELLRAVPKT